jgi:hypothetical protein
MEVNRFSFFIIMGFSILIKIAAGFFYIVFLINSNKTDFLYLTRVDKNQFFDLCDILDCEKNGLLLKTIINTLALAVFTIQFTMFSNRTSIFIFKEGLPELSIYITPLANISKIKITHLVSYLSIIMMTLVYQPEEYIVIDIDNESARLLYKTLII